MDLEDITAEMSRPIEALKFINVIFETEIGEKSYSMTSQEQKELFELLYTYSYIIGILTENMFQIRAKYQQRLEEIIEKGNCIHVSTNLSSLQG